MDNYEDESDLRDNMLQAPGDHSAVEAGAVPKGASI